MQNVLTKKKFLLFSLVVAIVLITSLLISNFNDRGQNSVMSSEQSIDENDIPTITLSSDYAVAGKTDDLMRLATNVVVGYYDDFVEVWDMGEKYYSEVYSFQVEEVLKGEVADQIKVSIPKNRIKVVEYEGGNYEVDIPLPHYFVPDAKQKVILFLSEELNNGIYSPSSLPFQISFTVDGKSELLWRKNDILNSEILKTKTNKSFQVISEQNNISSIDEITGMDEEMLLSILKK